MSASRGEGAETRIEPAGEVPPESEPVALKEADVVERLRQRYPRDAWAFLLQVADSTGYAGAGRKLDAVAMSLWPSRGLELQGFEVKCSRRDWLKELATPGKAEPVARYLDRFYVVAGHKDVVRPGEVPKGWGLMVPHGLGLTVRVDAERLDPAPIDRGFLAAILRRTQEASENHAKLDAAYDKGYRDGKNAANLTRADDLASAKAQLKRMETSVREFEAASGVRIGTWGAGSVGRAVRVVLQGGAEAHRAELQSTVAALRRTLQQAERDLADIGADTNADKK